MKKFFIFIVTLMLVIGMIIPTIAEQSYDFKSISYENNLLMGEVIMPENEINYIRVVMYLEGNYYIKIFLPIALDGTFELPIYAPVEYITAAIVKDIDWQSNLYNKPLAVIEYLIK